MFNKTKTILLAVAIAVSLPSLIQADTKPPSYPPKVAVMLLAEEYSSKMGVSPFQVKYVLKHESGYSQDAVGDKGKAVGVSQYHLDTFNRYEGLFFKATGQRLNYNSAQDQITLMTWQWRVYPQSKHEWSTYRNLNKVK